MFGGGGGGGGEDEDEAPQPGEIFLLSLLPARTLTDLSLPELRRERVSWLSTVATATDVGCVWGGGFNHEASLKFSSPPKVQFGTRQSEC